MPDLSTQIESAASTPQSASLDGQSATARAVGDLIAADQYLAAKAAAKTRLRGVAYTKLTTPGALSDCGRAAGGFDSCGGIV